MFLSFEKRLRKNASLYLVYSACTCSPSQVYSLTGNHWVMVNCVNYPCQGDYVCPKCVHLSSGHVLTLQLSGRQADLTMASAHLMHALVHYTHALSVQYESILATNEQQSVQRLTCSNDKRCLVLLGLTLIVLIICIASTGESTSCQLRFVSPTSSSTSWHWSNQQCTQFLCCDLS